MRVVSKSRYMGNGERITERNRCIETAKRIGITNSPEGVGKSEQGDQVRRGECQVSRVEWIETEKKT